ncbi:MAG: mandelate racemase/muconate lactonizing enzyme family protein [Actinobacteria bacterium]|nr:mandelate racemase/muconate lactonizing enzyme family protein [Actinomycetota bacterium]
MGGLSVTVRTASIPLARPTRISTRVLGAREFVLVSVERDGMVGTGYTYAGTSGGSVVAGMVREVLVTAIDSCDPDDIVGIWEAMFQESLLIGRRGAALRAMSAVDMALWDLAGKRAGLPLAVLLGGSLQPLAAYASGGYYRPDDGEWADAVAREISENRAAGFTDHKIKVGGLSVADDARRVAAAIAAMEGEGRLALDANNAYRSVAEAAKAAAAFERAAGDTGDTGLWWFEEPLSPEDVSGHARLRDRIQTPIATGEIAQTRHEFRTIIELGAADIIQPDAGVLGGVTEYMRVVRTAETFGVQVAPHWHANVHVHLAAASTTGITVEHFELSKDIYNFERIVTPETRLAYSGGMLTIPDRPGIGIEFDQQALDELGVAV